MSSDIDPRLTGTRRTGPDRKLTPEREEELVADYIAGTLKLREMEEKYDLTRPGIYGVLDRHRVPRGSKPEIEVPEPEPKAAA